MHAILFGEPQPWTFAKDMWLTLSRPTTSTLSTTVAQHIYVVHLTSFVNTLPMLFLKCSRKSGGSLIFKHAEVTIFKLILLFPERGEKNAGFLNGFVTGKYFRGRGSWLVIFIALFLVLRMLQPKLLSLLLKNWLYRRTPVGAEFNQRKESEKQRETAKRGGFMQCS